MYRNFILHKGGSHWKSVGICSLFNCFNCSSAQSWISALNVDAYRRLAFRLPDPYITCFTAIIICIEKPILYCCNSLAEPKLSFTLLSLLWCLRFTLTFNLWRVGSLNSLLPDVICAHMAS
ncbi:UNVERIFIED_ORG: hypothetical protein C7429_103204 [Pantoea allii]|nr:Uncharacterised protein [Pantoea agglomerans]SUC48791.1 Uncharacterised protein [Pantoea agglomerans]